MSVYFKDPDAILDYSFDWSDWLQAGETISSRVTEVVSDAEDPPDLTIDSDQESGGIVTVWLSGGTALVAYSVRCEIETSGNRTDERTMIIRVEER